MTRQLWSFIYQQPELPATISPMISEIFFFKVPPLEVVNNWNSDTLPWFISPSCGMRNALCVECGVLKNVSASCTCPDVRLVGWDGGGDDGGNVRCHSVSQNNLACFWYLKCTALCRCHCLSMGFIITPLLSLSLHPFTLHPVHTCKMH